jgi:hypothetical protein
MSADMEDDTRLIDQWVASDQLKPCHLHVSEQRFEPTAFRFTCSSNRHDVRELTLHSTHHIVPVMAITCLTWQLSMQYHERRCYSEPAFPACSTFPCVLANAAVNWFTVNQRITQRTLIQHTL